MTCKKNRNGFTLAEVLGVIIILGVIMALAFPSLLKQFKKSEDSIDKTTKTLIIEATKDYLNSTYSISSLSSYKTKCVEISNLVSNNFLTEKQIENLDTSTKYVKVLFDGESTSYELCEECSTGTNGDFLLNGEEIVTLKIGEGYNELGAVAYDENGDNVSSTIISTIYNSKGNIVTSIDSSKTGTYQIKYAYGNYQIEREVKVIDDIKPIIVVELLDDRIADTVLTYDLLSKITVTDNSDESITPVVKTNLSLGVPGVYIITITATDSSGNKTEVSKHIEVYNES